MQKLGPDQLDYFFKDPSGEAATKAMRILNGAIIGGGVGFFYKLHVVDFTFRVGVGAFLKDGVVVGFYAYPVIWG